MNDDDKEAKRIPVTVFILLMYVILTTLLAIYLEWNYGIMGGF